MDTFTPIRAAPPALELLDQTELPHQEVWLSLRSVEALREAILSLRVRGAPLLGLVGAAGVAIAAGEYGPGEAELRTATERIASARPTAVELRTGAEGALRVALTTAEGKRESALWDHFRRYLERRIAADLRLSEHGAGLLGPGSAVLTHCNTGALATGGIGTAFGIVRVAFEQGRLAHCYATETRPLLQGARLTAWELRKSGIPGSLVPDTAAAALIASGKIAAVITGADRIAMNGDSANKVGTYGLAAVAARHGVPFYIAAPTTTVDPGCASGDGIPIEFRDASEVGGFGGQRWSPEGLGVYNPAFDVTPAELIAGIITEQGVVRAPYEVTLARVVSRP